MNYSICIETFFAELDFNERIKRVIDLGFERIEFWDYKDKDITNLEKLVENGAIEISTFSGHRNGDLFSDDGFKLYFDELKTSIEIAKRLNTKGLMILSQGLLPDGRAISTGMPVDMRKKDRIESNLLKLVELADKKNISLYLEPLNSKIDHHGIFLDSSKIAFELVKSIIDKTGSEKLKVLYDIYHMQIMEGDIINTITNNISLIGYIHIADVPGRHEPGTGELNYKNILKTINNLQYRGNIGFELFPLNNSTNTLQLLATTYMI